MIINLPYCINIHTLSSKRERTDIIFEIIWRASFVFLAGQSSSRQSFSSPQINNREDHFLIFNVEIVSTWSNLILAPIPLVRPPLGSPWKCQCGHTRLIYSIVHGIYLFWKKKTEIDCFIANIAENRYES